MRSRPFKKVVLPDRIVNYIHLLAAGKFHHFRGKVIACVDDHLIGAGFLRNLRLGITACRAINGRAEHLGHLDNQASRAARGCVNQALVPCFQRKRRVGQVMRGHPLQHGCGGIVEFNAVGQ